MGAARAGRAAHRSTATVRGSCRSTASSELAERLLGARHVALLYGAGSTSVDALALF